MYIDHPGQAETQDRSERTVRDLVGVLDEDATYDEDTQSLVAHAKVYSNFRPLLGELQEDIGVSIRAWADVADDGVVTKLLEVLSVDYVTRAGRGGKVLALVESAKSAEAASQDRREQLDRAVTQAYEDRDNERYAWIRDFDEDARICWFGADNTLWGQSYTVAQDDLSVTLTGERFEVRAVTQYIPVNQPAPAGGASTQEAAMPEIDQAELDALRESASRVSTLETERDAAAKERDEAREALAQSRAANNAALIAASELPQLARDRVADRVANQPDLDVAEAINAEALYLAQVAQAQPAGVGASKSAQEAGANRPSRSPWGRTITDKES